MQQFLYLARHAHADQSAPTDEERPLSDKGLKQMRRLIIGLHDKDLFHPETIWHSGLVRAQETAQALNDGLILSLPISQMPGLAPEDDPSEIADCIEKSEQSCLIAGHEPNLSTLAAMLLASDGEGPSVVFAKGSILCLSRMKVGRQSTSWQIEWHVSHHFFKKSIS